MNYNMPLASSPEQIKDATSLQSSVMDASEYDQATAESGWDTPVRMQRLVEEYVSEGTLVLDIGIGTGQAVKGYRDKGAIVVGLDNDPKMLEVAQRVIGDGGECRLADINAELPVADLEGQFNLVQASGVLEFAKSLSNFTDQASAALAPSGVLVFATEVPQIGGAETQQYGDVTIHRRYPAEVIALLEEKEFELLADEAYTGYVRDDNEEVPYHMYLARKVNK